MNTLYPIFLKLEGKKCFVLGGGEVAFRKIASLLDCGAIVLAVSLEFDHRLCHTAEIDSRLTLRKGEWSAADLKGSVLAIAATDDEKANKRLKEEADKLGIIANVVDKPDFCTFYVPASFCRGDLQIAISTGGTSPAVAKRIKEELEFQYGECWAVLLEAFAKVRDEIKEKYPKDAEKRGEIMKQLANSNIIKKMEELSKGELIEEMRKWI